MRTGKIGPGQFSKTLGAAPRNILPNRSRRFELTGFEKLSVNSAIAYYFNIKFKAKFKFIFEYLPDSLLTEVYPTLPLKPNSNLMSQYL